MVKTCTSVILRDMLIQVMILFPIVYIRKYIRIYEEINEEQKVLHLQSFRSSFFYEFMI